MINIPESEAIDMAANLLSNFTGDRLSNVVYQPVDNVAGFYSIPDAFIILDRFRFVVEHKSLSNSNSILTAIRQLQRFLHSVDEHGIPLIVVPFMGETGKDLCSDAGISWLDLCGNASIKSNGLLIKVSGEPNRFIKRGRKTGIFSPKSSRVIRWLLLHPDIEFRQIDIAKAIGLDKGYVSRIVGNLLDDDYITKIKSDIFLLKDYDRLLTDWRDAYRFDKHRIIKGVVPTRTGSELAKRLADACSDHSLDYAMTGLPAAWLYTKHAMYRLVTVYMKTPPNREFLSALSFTAESRGANTWFVIPNDEGVFYKSGSVEDVKCVNPLQVYLDLKDQPERSSEAADDLLKIIKRSKHD